MVIKKKKCVTSSTLLEVLADVSKKINPCCRANCKPSSVDTCLCFSKSSLFPINIITMLTFAFCRASSNQLFKWLNVSRLLTGLEDVNYHPPQSKLTTWSRHTPEEHLLLLCSMNV
eukprot:TRINITY_DN2753_c0_g2_i24.p1 TRINITY_DN2753_c0_g2~~TRINITY_DN2753_c0_g2_i24.p1  ORF type:complete len:116 (+),score=6.91 TRINITY_DN2753_c0_g2_i24:462-809(+)